MESKTLSPYPDNADAKAAFRKPSNDATNRKYRRRSSVSGSSSSDGSPTREHSSSPIYSRDNSARDSDLQRRNDDRRDVNRDSGRSHRSRSGDSYMNSDRQSSRSSHDYHRRDDHVRHEKYRDDTRRGSEHYKSRDPLHGDDKYSRYRSSGSGNRNRDKDKGDRGARDEKREYRSLGDHKGDLSPLYEEYRGNRNDSTSRRYGARHRSKEASNSDPREFEAQKHAKEEKKKYADQETGRHKDRYDRPPGEQFEDKSGFTNENHEFSAKNPKLVSLGTDHGKADERLPSSTKEAHELVGKVTSEEAPAKGSESANDFDAAKIAAMKAAELVNKNLVGTGYMSTDQKKKLLWGNKKNTAAEESGHRWDATLFPDRERQEKFNKLMGVKSDVKAPEHKPDNQESSGLQAEKQMEQLQLDLEKQYTAGLRRRDGRTVGLGL